MKLKIGKRKCEKGRVIGGKWIISGIVSGRNYYFCIYFIMNDT